jgi:hypothetical protein
MKKPRDNYFVPYIHDHTYSHVCIYMHIQISIMYPWIDRYTQTYVYLCYMCGHTNTYIYICNHIYICIYIYMYNIYIYIYIYIYI